MIRPERVAIEPHAAAGDNRLPGMVERVVFLGGRTRCTCACSAASCCEATVSNDGKQPPFTLEQGAAVSLYLPPDGLRVLAPSRAPAEPEAGVNVAQIAPGLWRWTGFYEEWKHDVGCVYLETRDGICLIDPLVPPEDATRFWDTLDRDVEQAGGPVHVLITIFWHARDTAAVVARYGARVWAPAGAKAAVAHRAGVVTDPFRPGDRLPAGIDAYPSGRRSEVVYHLREHAALVAGDALLGGENGGVRLCPESWLPRGTGHAELRRALTPLLDLEPERVLVSHGEPVLARGADALRSALSS